MKLPGNGPRQGEVVKKIDSLFSEKGMEHFFYLSGVKSPKGEFVTMKMGTKKTRAMGIIGYKYLRFVISINNGCVLVVFKFGGLSAKFLKHGV